MIHYGETNVKSTFTLTIPPKYDMLNHKGSDTMQDLWLQILLTALNAVLPIILMIALGYILRQKKMLSESFLTIGNKLVFKLCLPTMLFVNIYGVASLSDIRWDVVGYCAVALCVIFGAGMLIAVLTTPVPKRRGVMAQCTFRSNYAIIGMPLAASLGGAAAEAVAAVVSSVAVPILNVLAVISLSVFVNQGENGKISVKRILLDIVKNPLIQGVAAGMLCLVLRWAQRELFGDVVFSISRDTEFLYTVLNYLKAITTPLALIVLGGQFTFSAVKELRKEIIVATSSRVFLAPIIGIGGAIALTLAGVLRCGTAEFPALVALFGSPVSVSSAIMASQMHNDEQLATQLVVWTTIISGITVFLISCGLMAAGYITV